MGVGRQNCPPSEKVVRTGIGKEAGRFSTVPPLRAAAKDAAPRLGPREQHSNSTLGLIIASKYGPLICALSLFFGVFVG